MINLSTINHKDYEITVLQQKLSHFEFLVTEKDKFKNENLNLNAMIQTLKGEFESKNE